MMDKILPHAGLTLGTLLTFLRISAFFAVSPFPGPTAPAKVRLILAAGVSWAIGSFGPIQEPELLWSSVLGEVVLGLAAGFLLVVTMHAFSFAGEAAGLQMGLGSPGFANPLQANLTVVGSAFAFIAMAVFTLAEGPEKIVVLLSRSLELVPPGSFGNGFNGLEIVLTAGNDLFILAIQLAAPMIASVFAAQIILAVLARSVPTLNLFIEGPALTTSSGVIGLLASVHTFIPMVDRSFGQRFEQLAEWLLY